MPHAIGFGSASDWLKKLREFCQPITERTKAKSKQTRIPCDTHLKTALNSLTLHSCITDPCKTIGCKAPYNIGCRVVGDSAECVCPICPNTLSPVCTSDGVEDRSECFMKRQSCLTDELVTVAKAGPCG